MVLWPKIEMRYSKAFGVLWVDFSKWITSAVGAVDTQRITSRDEKKHLLFSNNELEMPTSLYLLCFHAMILFFFFFFLRFPLVGGLAGTWRQGAGKGDLVISRNGLFRTGVDSLVCWLTVLSTLLLFPFFYFLFFPLSFYLLASLSLPLSLPPFPLNRGSTSSA